MICDNIKFSIQWGYFDIIIQRYDKHIYGCISFCPYLDGHVSLTDLIKFARVPWGGSRVWVVNFGQS